MPGRWCGEASRARSWPAVPTTCWWWARAGAGRWPGWGGKVTRYCLAHARCPVLAVPPPALARQAGGGLRAFVYWHRELTLERALREWENEALDHHCR
ncbi:MAG: hypothetical protein ACM32E_26865 [Gemmatimonadota bacterium]